MNIKVLKKRVLSSDGKHTLAGKVYLPEGEPKGLFHVVHGMEEHIGRYDRIMREMAEEGYITFGYDNLGHGYSVNSDDERGFIAEKSGWKYLINDVAVFGRAMKKQYGEDLPYILLGHSMGSFIVRSAAEHFDIHDKLIIVGTGGPNKAAPAGLALISAMKAAPGCKSGRFVSEKITKLAFGTYNERFEGESIHRWISGDPEVVEAFDNDPLCQARFTVSAMGDLIRLSIRCNTRRWFESINKEKPILLISGSEDPVGDYGSGVNAVYEGLIACGADVHMKLYEGYRHEILNDSCHDEVVADIKDFIRE